MSIDKDRGMFWLKKSAETGNAMGQFLYGSKLLATHGGDKEKIKEGFKYTGAAADQSDKDPKTALDAMQKYVDANMNKIGSKAEVKKAIGYCDKLKAAADDSFNKKIYDDTKKKLKDMLQADKRSGTRRKKKKGPLLLAAAVVVGVVVKFTDVPVKVADWYKDSSLKGVVELATSFLDKGDGGSTQKNNQSSAKKDNQKGSDKAAQEAAGTSALPADFSVKVTAANVNIRTGAGTAADVLTVAAAGMVFTATGNTELVQNADGETTWYEILLEDGRVGWISGNVAEIVE